MDEVYARQASRAALVADWLKALRLKPGDRVLEIGAGPGFVSFALAERVGPTGMVHAVDRSAQALANLESIYINAKAIASLRLIGAAKRPRSPEKSNGRTHPIEVDARRTN